MLTVFMSLGLLAAPPQAAPAPYPPATVEAIHVLLEDERRAEALYAAVLQRHGDVRPFSRIIEAERRHQGALEGLLTARGLPVPPNPWGARPVKAPATLLEANREGARAEAENVALYDRLLKTVREPEVVEVFERLRWASQERHLPAFRRHARP